MWTIEPIAIARAGTWHGAVKEREPGVGPWSRGSHSLHALHVRSASPRRAVGHPEIFLVRYFSTRVTTP